MKKIIFILGLIFVCLTLFGCGSSDADVVGKWETTGHDLDGVAVKNSAMLEIKADKTFRAFIDSPNSTDLIYEGTWSISGSDLILQLKTISTASGVKASKETTSKIALSINYYRSGITKSPTVSLRVVESETNSVSPKTIFHREESK